MGFWTWWHREFANEARFIGKTNTDGVIILQTLQCATQICFTITFFVQLVFLFQLIKSALTTKLINMRASNEQSAAVSWFWLSVPLHCVDTSCQVKHHRQGPARDFIHFRPECTTVASQPSFFCSLSPHAKRGMSGKKGQAEVTQIHWA